MRRNQALSLGRLRGPWNIVDAEAATGKRWRWLGLQVDETDGKPSKDMPKSPPRVKTERRGDPRPPPSLQLPTALRKSAIRQLETDGLAWYSRLDGRTGMGRMLEIIQAKATLRGRRGLRLRALRPKPHWRTNCVIEWALNGTPKGFSFSSKFGGPKQNWWKALRK